MASVRGLFLITIFLFVLIPAAYGADVYKWTDTDGIAHFTDDPNNVPSLYRSKIEVKEYPSEGGTAVQPERVTPRPLSKGDELERVDVYGQSAKGQVVWEERREKEKANVDVDLFGQDESYWRGKVQPWEERLREATANYERARDQFMQRAEELSQMRFGSPTQYKMKIAELDEVRGDMLKYQAQIAEAEEILKNISKEAQEAKANPHWLK